MACTSVFVPPPLVVGAFTGIEFRNLPRPSGDCNGFFIDDVFIFATVIVPPNTEVTLDIKIANHTFRSDNVINNNPTPTFAVCSGAIAIGADGKSFEFNDSGGNPQTVNIDGFWQDGVTAVVAADSIPSGSAPTTIIWDSFQVDFGMIAATNYDGTDPPNPPTDPELETVPDPDDDEQFDVSFSWTDNSTDELGFEVQRSLDGASWETIGFTTAGITTFLDALVDDETTYFYRVRSFKGDGVPANSGSSEWIESSIEFVIPDINMIGSGGIDLGGAAPTVFILNPSGIYTIVPGKTHDTLYERMTGIDSVNVKIPDPFVKTAFIGHKNE